MDDYYKGRKVHGGSRYPRVYWPDHPYSHDGQMVYVHRDVALDKYGELPEGYHVHHEDEDKWNWHPDNLELVPRGEHLSEHKQGSPEPRLCGMCGSELKVVTARDKEKPEVFCNQTCFKQSLERINWPTDEELLHRLKTDTFVKVAKELGVSDTAVRKRLRIRNKL